MQTQTCTLLPRLLALTLSLLFVGSVRAQATVVYVSSAIARDSPLDNAVWHTHQGALAFTSRHEMSLKRTSTSDSTTAYWIYKNGFDTQVVANSGSILHNFYYMDLNPYWLPPPDGTLQTISAGWNVPSGNHTAFFKNNFSGNPGVGEQNGYTVTGAFSVVTP